MAGGGCLKARPAAADLARRACLAVTPSALAIVVLIDAGLAGGQLPDAYPSRSPVEHLASALVTAVLFRASPPGARARARDRRPPPRRAGAQHRAMAARGVAQLKVVGLTPPGF
jgi:hypothetical protein